MKKAAFGIFLMLLLLMSMMTFPLVSSISTLETSSQQSPIDAPTSSETGSFASEGTYLRIGIDSYAHYGDFGIGYGFQYPKGFEHAAVAWWGEGFTFGYLVDGREFVSTSYESGPFGGLMFVSETVIRDDANEAIYEVVLRTADGRVELVHNFRFPKATKFVILNVTIRNVSPDMLSGVRYRRVWDFDMDNTVDGRDGFDVDISRNMLYAWETHYAALAASSATPPSEWDVWAWDDRSARLPGPTTYNGPFPVFGDYNVRLEWVYDLMPAGTSFSIIMYHIGGDSKSDLDNSYALAEVMVRPPVSRLLSISPNRGGNTGTVTVKITGVGLNEGAVVKLEREGYADIEGMNTTVTATTLITTVFNLTGAEPGLWDVVATLPGDVELRLPSSFTVEAGGAPNIFVDIVGRNQMRVGIPQDYYVRVINRGNVDAHSVFLAINCSHNIEYVTLEGQPIDAEADVLSTETGKILLLYIGKVGAYQSISFRLKLLATSGGSFLGAFLVFTVIVVAPVIIDFVTKLVIYCAKEGYTIPEAAQKAIRDALEAAPFAIAIGAVIEILLEVGIPGGIVISALISIVAQFRREARSSSLKDVAAVMAWDPNEKAGPTGFDTRGFIPAGMPLEYTVYFENLANATAPAQKVVITDSLDVDLDWNSFSFGEVSFGNMIISADKEVVDLRPDMNLLVKINKTIDKTNGLVTWIFESIDPETGLPPEDPLIGFLPPNKNPPEGEGWVKFSIYPKADLPSGTEIMNQATIIFDVNPPIETNTVLNTIDILPPVSAVEPLPPISPPEFIVSWSGNDGDGSGVRDYIIFVSENGGPYMPWYVEEDIVPTVHTKKTSAIFRGKPGHTYSFYSIAVDNVGNMEEPPAEPDATTTIAQYYLTVKTEPAGIATIPGEGWYDPYTWVNLTAPLEPNVKYLFAYWTVDGMQYFNNSIQVYMDGPKTAIAVYKDYLGEAKEEINCLRTYIIQLYTNRRIGWIEYVHFMRDLFKTEKNIEKAIRNLDEERAGYDDKMMGFEELRMAVMRLRHMIKDAQEWARRRKIPADNATWIIGELENIRMKLVSKARAEALAERALALKAIEDAKAGGKDTTKAEAEIAKVDCQLAKAEQKMLEGKLAQAIQHFKHAFAHSQFAIKKAFDPTWTINYKDWIDELEETDP